MCDAHALGTTVGIASTTGKNGDDDHKIESAIHRKYRLQDAAVRLLSDESITTCMRCTAPLDPRYPMGGTHDYVQVHRNSENGKVRVENLITCDRVWICPVCAARIGEQRRDELRLIYEKSGKHFALVTFTLRHDLKTPLKWSVSAISNALRRFKSGRWWQGVKYEYSVLGTVSGLEVTYGQKHGWHPHFHMLLVMDKHHGHVGLEALEVAMKERWLACLAQEGASGTWDNALDVSHDHARLAEYIAKHGYAPDDAWTEAEEMTRSRSKTAKQGGKTPWGLLDDYDKGDKQAGALFVEYAEATKGRNQLRWSPGLREAVNFEQLQADHADEGDNQDGEAVWMSVEKRYWWALSAHRLRADFIQAAVDDDKIRAVEILIEATHKQNKRYERYRRNRTQ